MGKGGSFIVNRKGLLKHGFMGFMLIALILSVFMAHYALSEVSVYDKVSAGDYVDVGIDKTRGIHMDLVEKGLTHKVLEFEIENDIPVQDIQLLIAENNFDASSGVLTKYSVSIEEEPIYETICSPYDIEDPVNHSANTVLNCTMIQTGIRNVDVEEWVPVELKAAEDIGETSLSTFNILEKGRYRYSFDTPIVRNSKGWGNAGTVFLKVGSDLYADKQHSSYWNGNYYKRQIALPMTLNKFELFYVTINTAQLINDGKLNKNCTGLHLIYSSPNSSNYDIDYVFGNYSFFGLTNSPVISGGGCNDINTTIMFRLQNGTSGEYLNYSFYYGNFNDTRKENASSTFLMFDDFQDGNSNGWFGDLGSYSVVNGALKSGSTGWNRIAFNFSNTDIPISNGLKWHITMYRTGESYNYIGNTTSPLAPPITGKIPFYAGYSGNNYNHGYNMGPSGNVDYKISTTRAASSAWNNITTYLDITALQDYSWLNGNRIIWDTANLSPIHRENLNSFQVTYENADSYIDNIALWLVPDNQSFIVGIERVYNTPPSVSFNAIQPSIAYNPYDLNCSFIVTDVDVGDSLSANISWYKNDALQFSFNISVTNGTLASNILHNANTTKGETWNCSVVAYDGTAYSDESSAVRVISNAAPNITSYNASNATQVYYTPDVNFSEGENLTFAVFVSDADVADGNETLWYSWFVDSILQPLEHNSWFSRAFDFLSAGVYTIRVDVNDSDNARTNQTWYVNIADVVNKVWSVDYAYPTPANNTNLVSTSVNISILVTPSLIKEATLQTLFHNSSAFTGDFNRTILNNTDHSIQLSYANLSGTYTSNIADMGENVAWDNLSWSELIPTDGELEPQNNLAGLWHMNNDWLDSSGYNNDGTASGAVFTTESKLGSHAGSFDGLDDYVSVPSTSGDELDLKSDMSVTAWIKWKGPSDPPDIYYPRIIEKDYQTSYMFSLRPDDATRLSVWLQNSERASTPSGSISLNEWHLVGFTFNDTSNEVKVYVDGVETGSGSYTGAISGSANNVYMGRYPGSAVAYFNGSIDEAAIWNRSLTAEEIQGIYNATAGGIKMQARSCDDVNCDTELFTGPSGASSYFSNSSFNDISFLAGSQYFQYKAFFETTDASVTPFLYNVTVKAHTQQVTENVSINNAWIDFNGGIYSMNGAGFSWSYANSTLDKGGYTYRVYVNDSFGNVNATETRVFSVPSYNITFNVTSGEDGSAKNNVVITCDYSGFSQGGDMTNMYGAYSFPVGSWSCTFALDFYYNKTTTFLADSNQIISVKISQKRDMTNEEHNWLESLYNCIIGKDCDAYTLLQTINQTTNKIWQQYLPTDTSVLAQEVTLSNTLSASSNISINYTINVPYKEGYANGALLPIMISYWFTDNTGKCYSQDKQADSNKASYPFCIPLIAEYLGPNNGSVSFKVDLHPNLPDGTYNITRSIDIDPPVNGEPVWINYGREVIGSINVLKRITPSLLEDAEQKVDGVNVDAKAPALPSLSSITGGAIIDGEYKASPLLLAVSILIGLTIICMTITILGVTYLRRRE